MTSSEAAVDSKTGAVLAGSFMEEPIFYEAAGETLFALHSWPAGESRDVGVILLGGGWLGTSADRNRTLVRLARELAGVGFHVVRLDWRGMGESTGEVDRYRLTEPFVDDLVGAVDVLGASGIRRVVTVGVCFGARTSLSAASLIPGLAGLVLASVPVEQIGPSVGRFRVSFLVNRLTLRELLRRGLRLQVLGGLMDGGVRRGYRKAWLARWRARAAGTQVVPAPTVEPSVLAGLTEAARRQLPVLFLYGEEDDDYAGFQALQSNVAASVPIDAGRVELRAFPGTLTGFPQLETQERFVASVVEWMDGRFRGRSMA